MLDLPLGAPGGNLYVIRLNILVILERYKHEEASPVNAHMEWRGEKKIRLVEMDTEEKGRGPEFMRRVSWRQVDGRVRGEVETSKAKGQCG